MSAEKKLCTQSIPPLPGPTMRIERIGAGSRWTVCLLGPLWGVWTHWHGEAKRSQGCYGDQSDDCEGCKRGLPRRWKGYLHVIHLEAGEECFVEITPVIAQALACQIPRDIPYRGNRLTIKRGAGLKARLEATLLPAERNIELLPASKDPEAILKALWSEEFRLRKRGGIKLADYTQSA